MKVSDGLSEGIIDGHFEIFWMAGLVKVKKKNARVSFKKALKGRKDTFAFTEMLVDDIQKRLEINQFGFSSLHPTSYLNGERWEDEYRGQVNETNQRTNQTHSQRTHEQAQHAIAQMVTGDAEIDISAIRSIQ